MAGSKGGNSWWPSATRPASNRRTVGRGGSPHGPPRAWRGVGGDCPWRRFKGCHPLAGIFKGGTPLKPGFQGGGQPPLARDIASLCITLPFSLFFAAGNFLPRCHRCGLATSPKTSGVVSWY